MSNKKIQAGLTHLAVALKVPTVAIYTDTDPRDTGIYPRLNSAAINLGGRSNDELGAGLIAY